MALRWGMYLGPLTFQLFPEKQLFANRNIAIVIEMS
jgi:hypothetical protein